MKEYRMNVSIAINERFVPYAYTMLLSLFRNNSDAEVFLYVLQCELTAASKARLEELAESYGNHVIYLVIDLEQLNDENLPRTANWPIEVYFRLFLPDLLPMDAERLLYLDSDMIVNRSLRELYHIDLDGKLLAGCRDLAVRDVTVDVCLGLGRSERFRALFEEKRYINSGMILFDMKELRKKYHFRDYMDLARELDYQIVAPDQDLINLMHQDEIKYVDEWKYNFLAWDGVNYGYDKERTAREVVILHYAGKGAPWQGGNHVHYELESIWWEYALETPYAKGLAEQFTLEAVTDPALFLILSDLARQNEALSQENKKLQEDFLRAMEIVKKLTGNPQ